MSLFGDYLPGHARTRMPWTSVKNWTKPWTAFSNVAYSKSPLHFSKITKISSSLIIFSFDEARPDSEYWCQWVIFSVHWQRSFCDSYSERKRSKWSEYPGKVLNGVVLLCLREPRANRTQPVDRGPHDRHRSKKRHFELEKELLEIESTDCYWFRNINRAKK